MIYLLASILLCFVLYAVSMRLARRIEGAWKIKLGRRESINARDLVQVIGHFLDVVRSETTPAVSTRIFARIDLEVFSGSGTKLLEDKARPVKAEIVGEPIET